MFKTFHEFINENKKALNKNEAIWADYPKTAQENAKKVLNWKKKYKNEVKAMTKVGWARANQLSKGEKLSTETVSRMAAFKRHQKNKSINPKYKDTPWKDNGHVSWLGWGGDSGIQWAIDKMKELKTQYSNF